MKISIIVTVYNLEKYIEQCIISLINQTYKNLEIIIIDDGSQDHSSDICKKYEKMNKKVKYYYKKNGGASSARNLGIKKTTGEYLMFVDGDDYLYNDEVVANIVNILLEKKVDVLFLRMSSYYDKQNKIKVDQKYDVNEENIFDYNIFKTMVSQSKLSISPCDKIVKTSIIKKNNIFFNEELKIYEDIDWSFKLYLNSNLTYSFTNIITYTYRKQREGSATYNMNSDKIQSMYDVIDYWVNFDYTNKVIKTIFLNYISYQYCILLSFLNNKNSTKKLKDNIYNMSDILKYDSNYKVKKINKVKKIFGLKITIMISKIYTYIKKIGIFRVGEKNE